jgi:hypothetical protein
VGFILSRLIQELTKGGIDTHNIIGKKLNKFFVSLPCLWYSIECSLSNFSSKKLVSGVSFRFSNKDIFFRGVGGVVTSPRYENRNINDKS